MPRINKTRFVILAWVSYKPLSGYDIKKMIERSTSHFWSESNGQLYPILNELVEEELLTCTVDQSRGKRSRKVYTITAKGSTTLQDWLKLPVEPQRPRDELLIKLFFGKTTPIEVTKNHLLEEKKHLLEAEKMVAQMEQELKNFSQLPDYPYWLISLRAGQYYLESRKKWCEEALGILQKIKEPQAV